MTLQLGKKYYMGSTYQKSFLNYLKENKIAALKCKSCQALYFPPRQICPYCKTINEDPLWTELSGKGHVETFTTIHYPPVGFENNAPYTIVVVKLVEGPKILCIASEEVDVDDQVVLVPRSENDHVYLDCMKKNQ